MASESVSIFGRGRSIRQRSCGPLNTIASICEAFCTGGAGWVAMEEVGVEMTWRVCVRANPNDGPAGSKAPQHWEDSIRGGTREVTLIHICGWKQEQVAFDGVWNLIGLAPL
jgi:hypothetical protein